MGLGRSEEKGDIGGFGMKEDDAREEKSRRKSMVEMKTEGKAFDRGKWWTLIEDF